MDDQFKDGFERMLSDLGDPPTWAQVSTQMVTAGPTARRSRGLLVAAGAFALTLIIVGSVVVLGNRSSNPVAAEMVDYVKIEWSQNLELVCDGLEISDNDGFSESTIEIWGPNSEGLLLLVATAPDGTTETQVIEYDTRTAATLRIWAPAPFGASGDVDYRSTYRHAQCSMERPGGDSSWTISGPPIFTLNFRYGFFIGLPEEQRRGGPWSIDDLVGSDAVVTSDQWRGIPVDVYGRSTSYTNIYPELSSEDTSEFEFWVDPLDERLERELNGFTDDVLGSRATTVDVVERRSVLAGSVSFSTDGMTLVFDRSEFEDGTDKVPETTTSLAVEPRDTPAYNAYLVWLNQVGLNQDDLDMWIDRLDWICGIGWSPLPSDTPMMDAAGSFVTEDAELSVRSDGSLPSAVEAADSLWTIVADPRSCPARFKSSLDEVRDIDPLSIDSVDGIESALAAVRNAKTSAWDTEFEDMVIEFNETILMSDMVSIMERSRRSVFIDSARAHKVSETKAVMTLMELEMELLSRQLELKGLEVSEQPVLTLSGPSVVYSTTGTIPIQGWVDQMVTVAANGEPLSVHIEDSGRSSFTGELALTEGSHTVLVRASNDAGLYAEEWITVVVDPSLEVVFGFIEEIPAWEGGSWILFYDPAEWLTGEEARVAAIEDGEIPEGSDLPGDFYVRNPIDTFEELIVDAATIVTLQACWPDGGPCIIEEPASMTDFAALLEEPKSALAAFGWSWYGGNPPTPFWFTLEDDVVVQIAEQYLP